MISVFAKWIGRSAVVVVRVFDVAHGAMVVLIVEH